MLSLPHPTLFKTYIAGAFAAGLLGCGGAEDHADSFTGTWMGTRALTANGQGIEETSIPLNITSAAPNILELGNFCSDGSGPTATAVSDVEFDIEPFECSPVATDDCATYVYKVTAGKGTLAADGELTVTLNGVVTGCTGDTPYEGTFTGKSMYGAGRQSPMARR